MYDRCISFFRTDGDTYFIWWWHLFYYTSNSLAKNDENLKHMYHNGKGIPINCQSWISILLGIWNTNEKSKIANWKIRLWPVQRCLRHVFVSNMWFFYDLLKKPRFGLKKMECHDVTKKPQYLKKMNRFYICQHKLHFVCDRYWKFGAVSELWRDEKVGVFNVPSQQVAG